MPENSKSLDDLDNKDGKMIMRSIARKDTVTERSC